LNSQDSPQLRFGGSHHLPHYSILCVWPWDHHPNVILSRGSQVGVPKFPQLGLLQLWGRITLRADIRLKWGLKQSCSTCQDLFNGMSHATCTQGNRGNFLLLVVGSEIVNLTPNPSFGYNLCVKCPNGSCEPILDIFVPIAFQWYNEPFNSIGFDPCNCSLKIWESTGTPTPKVKAHLGCEGSFPHTLLHFRELEMWLIGFLLGPHFRKLLPWSQAQG
jgi:hypothetical protein